MTEHYGCSAKLQVVIVTASEVFAQSASTGALTGTVTDQTGAVVPKATITLRNTGTGQVLTAVTDLEGFIPLFIVAAWPI